jgi:DNA-binding NtrC family response regulator
VGGSGDTVLVVDDEPSIRLLCRVNLELEGYVVLEAGTLEEARARLAESLVDAVLLDVHVGAQSGIAFLRELRDDHPGLPVAFLTGSSPVDLAEHRKADGVVMKPFTLEHLSGAVRRLVAPGRRLDSPA